MEELVKYKVMLNVLSFFSDIRVLPSIRQKFHFMYLLLLKIIMNDFLLKILSFSWSKFGLAKIYRPSGWCDIHCDVQIMILFAIPTQLQFLIMQKQVLSMIVTSIILNFYLNFISFMVKFWGINGVVKICTASPQK